MDDTKTTWIKTIQDYMTSYGYLKTSTVRYNHQTDKIDKSIKHKLFGKEAESINLHISVLGGKTTTYFSKTYGCYDFIEVVSNSILNKEVETDLILDILKNSKYGMMKYIKEDFISLLSLRDSDNFDDDYIIWKLTKQ